MAQRRMIYSKIWASKQFGELSEAERLLYIGTITLADDEGKLNGNPAYLRGQIFPYDSYSVNQITSFLMNLDAQDLITQYEVDGAEYIKHPNWNTYQKLRKDRIRESGIPDTDQLSTKRQPSVNQVSEQDKVSKDKVSKIRQGNIATSKSVAVNPINKLIDLFKDVNPSFARLFRNKTQRDALQRMFDQHGEQKMEFIIKSLLESNKATYAPTVTTPYQLEEKMGSLIAYWQKQRARKEEGIDGPALVKIK